MPLQGWRIPEPPPCVSAILFKVISLGEFAGCNTHSARAAQDRIFRLCTRQAEKPGCRLSDRLRLCRLQLSVRGVARCLPSLVIEGATIRLKTAGGLGPAGGCSNGGATFPLAITRPAGSGQLLVRPGGQGQKSVAQGDISLSLVPGHVPGRQFGQDFPL